MGMKKAVSRRTERGRERRGKRIIDLEVTQHIPSHVFVTFR